MTTNSIGYNRLRKGLLVKEERCNISRDDFLKLQNIHGYKVENDIPGRCICGVPIDKYFYIQSRITNKRYRVGSKCITMFDEGHDMDCNICVKQLNKSHKASGFCNKCKKDPANAGKTFLTDVKSGQKFDLTRYVKYKKNTLTLGQLYETEGRKELIRHYEYCMRQYPDKIDEKSEKWRFIKALM